MSSISTYLDVAQATRGETQAATDTDPEVMARAQVLSRISAGADLVNALLEQSELSRDVAQAALDWLSQSGLVVIQEEDGDRHVHLTEAAKAALSSS